MPYLTLDLLRPFQATLDGREVTEFGYVQVKALLAYLAVESARPHHREVLGELLWPGRTTSSSRGLVRRALTTLRQALGDQHADPPFLLVTRDTIQFNPASDHGSDLGTFANLLEAEARHGHAAEELCAACVSALEQATNLYQGDFLPYLTLQASTGLSAWIQHNQALLHHQAGGALMRLASSYEQRSDWEAARRVLLRYLDQEPIDEAAHRRLMRIYLEQDKRAAALAQYAHCRQLLKDELNSVPEDETEQLYRAIRHGSAGGGGHFTGFSSRPAGHAPAPLPLIGRESELAALQAQLASPDCRLMSIVGGGGGGKSRLAYAAAEGSKRAFRDGAAVIALEAITEPAELAPTICRGLGNTFDSTHNTEVQLLAYLRERELLLILDNYEQLLPDTRLIGAILVHAPRVKVVVTSRLPLGLQAEWLVALDGLAYPTEPPGDDVEAYAAVQLFIRRAAQVELAFAPQAEDLRAIVRICHHLGGLPLGIELAAGWVRTLSCGEIAEMLQRDLDLLTTTRSDLPERHRSLRTLLDQAQARLSPRARHIFRQIATFQNSFTRIAAEQVIQATPHDLRELIDAALLQRQATGRYEVYGYVRQYAVEQLRVEAAE